MIHISRSTSNTVDRGRFVIDNEIWVSGALLLIALYVVSVAVGDFGLTQGEGGLGTGMLPALAGVGLAVTCVLLLGRSLTKGGPRAQDSENPTAGASWTKRWMVFGILVLASAAVNFLGFSLTAGLLVYLLIAWIERSGQVRAVIVATVTVVFIWAVFDLFVGVPLPRGIIF